MTEARNSHIEEFSDADLTGLREELMKSGLDSWQAAELISSFLVARGYGVSTQDARSVVLPHGVIGCSLKCLQAELEKLAQSCRRFTSFHGILSSSKLHIVGPAQSLSFLQTACKPSSSSPGTAISTRRPLASSAVAFASMLRR